jgi:hypothetical protein
MASGFTSLLSTVEKASAMIYIPKQERMWDSWMLYHKETYIGRSRAASIEIAGESAAGTYTSRRRSTGTASF